MSRRTVLVVFGVIVCLLFSVTHGGWLDPIALGVTDVDSRGSNSSGMDMYLKYPTSLALMANVDQLGVLDWGNSRIVVYNMSNVTTGDKQMFATNQTELQIRTISSPSVQSANPYLWIATNSTFIRWNSLSPLTLNQTFTFASASPVGITEDSSKNLLFVTYVSGNRTLISTVSKSNPINPTIIYAQQLAPALSRPLSSGPRKVILGCNNDYWVIDTGFHRALHFPARSNKPDVILGQPDFNTTIPHIQEGTGLFWNPSGGALNSDCTTIWIADSWNDRILRFDNPFKTGMNASDVLGPDGPGVGPEKFFTPYDVVLDYKRSRLWVADAFNGRIIGGVVNLYPAKTIYELPCIDPTDSVVCNVNSSISIGCKLLVFNYTTVKINGSIVFDNCSETVLNTGQTIQSSSANFGGQFTIVVSDVSDSQIVLASYNRSKGEFSQVSVKGIEQDSCRSNRLDYGERDLTLVLVSSGCSTGLSGGQIAGVTIGVCAACGLAVILVGVVILVVVFLQRKKKNTKGRGSIVF